MKQLTKKHKNIAPLLVIFIIIALFAHYKLNQSPADDASYEAITPAPVTTEAKPVVTQTPAQTTQSQTPVAPKPAAPAATITVVSPNGGEKWTMDGVYSVTWNYTGLKYEDTVSVALRSTDEKTVCWLGKSAVGKQRFDATAGNCSTPNKPFMPGQYKIQIVVDKYSDGMGVADTSNTAFSIVQAF